MTNKPDHVSVIPRFTDYALKITIGKKTFTSDADYVHKKRAETAAQELAIKLGIYYTVPK